MSRKEGGEEYPAPEAARGFPDPASIPDPIMTRSLKRLWPSCPRAKRRRLNRTIWDQRRHGVGFELVRSIRARLLRDADAVEFPEV